MGAGLAWLAVPVVLHIAGTAVPLSTFQGVPKVAIDLIQHAPPDKTVKDLIPVIASVSDIFAPGSGLAITMVALIIERSRPMTPAEERIWMDRFGAGHER